MRRNRFTLMTAAALCATALLLVSTVASATWTTIDTDNGQIDTAWDAPTYSDPCGNDGVSDPRNEIKNAWFKSDGDFLYFRMETCGSPALSNDFMRAIGALDCNNDGDFDDPSTLGPDGDRLVVYRYSYDTVNVFDGKYSPMLGDLGPEYVETFGPDIEWKVDLGMLPPLCRGSITPNTIGWAISQVYNVVNRSKQTYPWSNPMDYGDLPNPDPANNSCVQYPTRLPCNGARHGIVAGDVTLGATIDPDTGGLYDTMASLDDTTNTGATDDEDGVMPAKGFPWTSAGGRLDVTVSGGSGYLNCWVDWNNNQSLGDADEKVVNDLAVVPGTHSIAISTTTTVDGAYYARCRISPVTGAGITGPVYGGEVEDYRWLPQTSALAISRPNNTSPEAQLSWTEVSAADTYNIYRSTTPYLQPTGAPYATDDAAPFLDPVLGSPADTYFYIMTKVRTVDGTPMESVASNEVGVFEFALVTGF